MLSISMTNTTLTGGNEMSESPDRTTTEIMPANPVPMPPPAEFMRVMEYLQSLGMKMPGTAQEPIFKFRDLWVMYEKYCTAVDEHGLTRLMSWSQAQGVHAKHILAYYGDLDWQKCDITAGDAYRDWRKTIPSRVTGRMVVACTRNREMTSVQACLNWARKRNIIPRNPMAGQQDEPEESERGFAITREQFETVVRYARPILRPYLILLWETGMRRDEARRLRWSWIEDAGFIVIPKGRMHSKNGKGRRIPLSTLALAALKMQPRIPGCDYVFTNPTGTGPRSKASLSKWWREARDQSGICGPAGQPVWLHTLRHSAATELITVFGVDIQTLKDMFGWTSNEMVDLYVNIGNRERTAVKTNLNERSEGLISLLHMAPATRRGPVAAKRKAALVADPTKLVK
jgi:integrase